MNARTIRRPGWTTLSVVCCVLVALTCGQSVFAVQLGDVQITLHSCKYYQQADVTRVVYKVKSSPQPAPAYWVLEVGDCVTSDDIVAGASTDSVWVDEPFHGLRFTPTSTNEKVYLYLEGRWELTEGEVVAAFVDEEGEFVLHEGRLDVPLCQGASISIRILSGASVSFPEIAAAGTYESVRPTELRVESTSSAWTLQQGIAFSAPDGASTDTLARVFGLALAEYRADSGATDITASYELTIEEGDFVGLPEGTYVIGVTFTVASD